MNQIRFISERFKIRFRHYENREAGQRFEQGRIVYLGHSSTGNDDEDEENVNDQLEWLTSAGAFENAKTDPSS